MDSSHDDVPESLLSRQGKEPIRYSLSCGTWPAENRFNRSRDRLELSAPDFQMSRETPLGWTSKTTGENYAQRNVAQPVACGLNAQVTLQRAEELCTLPSRPPMLGQVAEEGDERRSIDVIHFHRSREGWASEAGRVMEVSRRPFWRSQHKPGTIAPGRDRHALHLTLLRCPAKSRGAPSERTHAMSRTTPGCATLPRNRKTSGLRSARTGNGRLPHHDRARRERRTCSR